MTSDTHLSHAQVALVVGGGHDVLEAVEPLLDGPRWTIEFVATDDEPYATVLAMQPDLVIVSLGLNDPESFGVLSMLRLDPRTRAIPVLSYVRDEANVGGLDLPVENSRLLPLDALITARAPRH